MGADVSNERARIARVLLAGRRLALIGGAGCLLLGVVAPALLAGCAAQPTTGFQRARNLQQGAIEVGGAISLARRPTEGALVARADEGQEGEPVLAPPIPALFFRTGITERLDAGLEAWPGGLKLHGKLGILDEDKLMLALIGTLGWYSTGWAPEDGDRFAARGPLVSLQAPLATRVLPWRELNVAPVVELLQLEAERWVYLELQRRSFVTLHSGFTFGANFAVWRVRINPEVALLGGYRGDREEGFWGVYPGVGAFIVF